MTPSKPVLVIAGFADGLGVALAEKYTSSGFAVVALSRQAPAESLMEKFGGRLTHYQVDLTKPAEAIPVLDRVISQHGAPNTLIHNVAQLDIRPFIETDIDTFISVWQAGCLSAVICARAFLPAMEGSGGGSVVFTGATASVRGAGDFAAFASAKFALRGLAQSLAREYGPRGIHVIHAVIDGLIWGPQTIARFAADREACLLPTDIADTYFGLSQQSASAWSHEVDLRPAGEKF